MSLSIFAPANTAQTITVTDCPTDVCRPVQSVTADGFAGIAQLVSPERGANVSFAIESFNVNTDLPCVSVLGPKGSKYNSFNRVSLPAAGLELMFSRYGMTDDCDFAVNELRSSVAVASSGATTLTGTTLNADFTPAAGFTAGTWARQFAQLVHLTFAETVYRAVITATGTASPIAESLTIEFTDTECREVTLLLIQTAQRYRFIQRYGVATDAEAIAYQLPYEPTAAENPGSGGILALAVATYDSTFTQAASSVDMVRWNIPWSTKLMSSVLNHRGIAAAGATAIYEPAGVEWPLGGRQPILAR